MWDSPAAVGRLIDDHVVRYPAMEPADAYKLLYQGVLGPEHLIASPEAFAARDQINLEEGLPTEMEDAYPAAYMNREFQLQAAWEHTADGDDQALFVATVRVRLRPQLAGDDSSSVPGGRRGEAQQR